MEAAGLLLLENNQCVVLTCGGAVDRRDPAVGPWLGFGIHAACHVPDGRGPRRRHETQMALALVAVAVAVGEGMALVP